jgi:hypothetical protein
MAETMADLRKNMPPYGPSAFEDESHSSSRHHQDPPG